MHRPPGRRGANWTTNAAAASAPLLLSGVTLLLPTPELQALAYWGALAANPTVGSNGGAGSGTGGGSGGGAAAAAALLGWRRSLLQRIQVRSESAAFEGC